MHFIEQWTLRITCITVKMKDIIYFLAVRFGRMPKVEREKLVADKEELSASCQSRIMDLRSLADTIKGAFVDCFTNCGPLSSFLNCNKTLKVYMFIFFSFRLTRGT